MLDPQSGWLLGVVVSLTLGAIANWMISAELGLATAVAVSLLFPDWLHPQWMGLTFTVKTTVCGFAIAAYTLPNPWRIKSSLTILDAAIALFFVIQTASNMKNGGTALSALHAYGEWVLPYVCGRFAMRDLTTFDYLPKIIAIILIVWGIGGVIEMTTATNPWELLFGNRTGQAARAASRYGFKRAFVNTEHPIFFGLQILVLLPICLSLLERHYSRISRSIGIAGVIGGLAAIISCVSRSPVLGLLLMSMMMPAVRIVWMRWVVGVVFAGCVLIFFNDPLSITTDFAEMTGEKIQENAVVINDETLPSSSALVRIWLVKAYWHAIELAGPLGNGTKATKTFPVNVPGMPAKAKTVQNLRWVDNAYLLIGLRFGWLGIGALVVFFASQFAESFRMSGHRVFGLYARWHFGMAASMMMILLTVWMSNDFGFEMLWTSGLLAGMSVYSRG